jgi:diguanylate cyclase (GGDEF)-like protein
VNRQEILLIEDDPDAREALTLLLEHHGYLVRSAANGTQALAEAGRRAPDLVITDLSMPGLSGLDVLERFRELPALADVPVIVVSAHHDVRYRVAGFDLGADDFLAKPVELDDLLARVRRQLLRSSRQREVARQSMVDELTGVLNRRGLTNLFARELERAHGKANGRSRESNGNSSGTGNGGTNTTVAVMLIDLNGFKRINDIWGHAAGDTMLCAVTRALQDALRATDRVGRMGGDEFAIVLPDVCVDDCSELAQRVRQVSPVIVNLAQHATLRVGLSLGVACAARGETFEAVLARADAAMYEDKQRQKLASDLLS